MNKMSRTSLAYRYINRFRGEYPVEPKSICSLFNALVGATLWYIAMVGVMFFLALFLTYPITQLFITNPDVSMLLSLFSMITWLFSGIFALVIVREKYPDKWVLFGGKNVPLEERSVMTQWVAAKKEKVCPTIRWED